MDVEGSDALTFGLSFGDMAIELIVVPAGPQSLRLVVSGKNLPLDEPRACTADSHTSTLMAYMEIFENSGTVKPLETFVSTSRGFCRDSGDESEHDYELSTTMFTEDSVSDADIDLEGSNDESIPDRLPTTIVADDSDQTSAAGSSGFIIFSLLSFLALGIPALFM